MLNETSSKSDLIVSNIFCGLYDTSIKASSVIGKSFLWLFFNYELVWGREIQDGCHQPATLLLFL